MEKETIYICIQDCSSVGIRIDCYKGKEYRGVPYLDDWIFITGENGDELFTYDKVRRCFNIKQ